MGEIADMMLDGTLCEGCGVYIESGNADGFPRYCSERCRRDRLGDDRYESRVPKANRYAKGQPRVQQPGEAIRIGDTMGCPFCVRRVKMVGFGQHMLDFHAEKWGDRK